MLSRVPFHGTDSPRTIIRDMSNPLKKSFLLDPGVIYLNHGSFGATPLPVFREYQRLQRELERQPVEFLGRRSTGMLAKARARLAEYLGTQADRLVFTTNVTMAINIVARSLELGPQDEVLSTDHEYGAMDRTWRFLARQRGFRYLKQPIPVPVADRAAFVETFWKGVTASTRVIFLSHIASPTALIFPVEEICRRARRASILTVIDGAHAPGQIPLRLDELGADFYGGNLHKWLCAPKGSGFLFARPEVQDLLQPLVVSWGYESETPGPSRFIDQQEWGGTRDLAAFLSVPAAIDFQEQHDWEGVRRICHDILRAAEQAICQRTGLARLHPDDPAWTMQMASVPLPAEIDAHLFQERLYREYRIEIPVMRWNGRNLLRISLQGYNTPRDAQALLKAVGELIQPVSPKRFQKKVP